MRSYNYHSPGPDDDYSHVRIGNRTVVDFVPADMLHLVPDHWYKFPPMEPYHHTLLGIAMTLMAIISIIGNGLVIYLFTTVKNLRSPTNLLVANLAFSDFCMMLNQSTIMAYNCFAQAWALGPLWCDLYAMWGSLFGNASIWSLVLISRDRYNAIVKGIAGEPLTYGKATLQITCIWVIALAWTVGPIFGWGRYVPEGNMTACALDYLTRDWKTLSYVVIYPCFVYFTPLFIILYSYFHIVKAVFEHERTLREQAKKMNVASLRNNANENKESQEIRIAKVALMTVSLWFIAWTPYLAIAWTGVFTDGELLTPLFTVWGGVLCKSAACYNPIIYAISHPKFKAALANMFCSSKGEKSLTTDATSETGKSVAMTEVSAVSG